MAIPQTYIDLLTCLAQARLLFELADSLDMDYLQRRIAEDGGNFACLTDTTKGG